MDGLRQIITYLALVVTGIVIGGVLDAILLGYRPEALLAPFSILFAGGVPAYYWYLGQKDVPVSPKKQLLTGATVILALLAVGLALKAIVTMWSPVVT